MTGEAGTPAAEVELDEPLVRTLLREQHPDLADFPLRQMESGWDNAMFRLGDAYVVRLPRRAVAATLVQNEQAWLPVLAPHLPLPIPSPVRVGLPGQAYPWHWSVLSWLAGHAADECPPRPDQAAVLGRFLKALHQCAPADAPENAVRGVALAERNDSVTARIAQLDDLGFGPVAAVEQAWLGGLAAPRTRQRSWLHGDLHARNVLVENGNLAAIIDWGDVTSGDVATDLAGIWGLFNDAAARRDALLSYGADRAEIARAMAWAVNIGTILLVTGLADNPRHARMGADMLRRVAADVVCGD